jgi:hypothetical protein
VRLIGLLTALCAQIKILFEKLILQAFQIISYGSFDQQLL